ncbi:MAG: ATP-binding cassette domain-containing protein, partial [archaeon]
EQYVGNIGVIFGQKSQLFWNLPPIDSFYLNKDIYSIDEKDFKERLDKLVKLLAVEDVIKKQTRQLSLGERMRCEFIIAMLHNPKIVFLDEPTIGLDLIAKETIRNFIKEANIKENITFIITSHDLEDIEHLCKRVVIINHGKILFDDNISKLKADNTKYITIEFNDSTIDADKIKKIKGATVEKKISNYSFELKINLEEIELDNLIKELSKIGKIEDIKINDPEISEFIKKFYEK